MAATAPLATLDAAPRVLARETKSHIAIAGSSAVGFAIAASPSRAPATRYIGLVRSNASTAATVSASASRSGLTEGPHCRTGTDPSHAIAIVAAARRPAARARQAIAAATKSVAAMLRTRPVTNGSPRLARWKYSGG